MGSCTPHNQDAPDERVEMIYKALARACWEGATYNDVRRAAEVIVEAIDAAQSSVPGSSQDA